MPLEQLVSGLPTIPIWDIEPVDLDGVEILQAQFELAATNVERFLPPALHPTIDHFSANVWRRASIDPVYAVIAWGVPTNHRRASLLLCFLAARTVGR